jgi:hypothetical protein
MLACLVCAVFLGLGSAACGEDEIPSTTAAVTTGTGHVSTTTSAEPLTTLSPSTTAAPPDASTTLPGGTTTTEALSSAETRLPNGNIKAMGFIDAVWEAEGTRYLSIDYAEMLTGPEAVEAAIDAGYIQPGEDLPNDYFIRNVNAQKREFTVADAVTITTSTFLGAPPGTAVSWETFTSFWTEFTPEGGEHLSEMPWWIERSGQEVVSISEQYLP